MYVHSLRQWISLGAATCIVVAGIIVPSLTFGQGATAFASQDDDFAGELIVELGSPQRAALSEVDNPLPLSFGIQCVNPDGSPVTPPASGLPSDIQTGSDGKAVVGSMPTNATCTVVPRNVPERCEFLSDSSTVTFTPQSTQQLAKFFISCRNSLSLEMIDGTTGAPLHGVELLIQSAGNTPAFRRDVVSDAEGKVHLGDVPGGSYSAQPKKIPSQYDQGEWASVFTVSDLPDEPADIQIAIERPHTDLRVKVVDKSGKPMAGLKAEVTCTPRDQVLGVKEDRLDRARGTWGMTQGQTGTNEAGIVIFRYEPAGSECTIDIEPPKDCYTELAAQGVSIPNAPEKTMDVTMVLTCEPDSPPPLLTPPPTVVVPPPPTVTPPPALVPPPGVVPPPAPSPQPEPEPEPEPENPKVKPSSKILPATGLDASSMGMGAFTLVLVGGVLVLRRRD